jgi:hypothetical protein
MPAWIPYGCPEDACKAIKELAEVRHRMGRASARPWEPDRPRETHWWLVPQDDESSWPAHPLGKFVFDFSEPGHLDVGLYVERGVNGVAADALGFGEHLVVTDDWMWSRFLADLSAGLVTEVARSILELANIEVFIGFVLKPQSEAAPSFEGPSVWLSPSSAKGLVLEPELDPKSSALLKPFRTVTSDEQLAARLGEVNDFTWIDAYVVASFAMATNRRPARTSG